jgi:hypothetical protein
MTDRNEQSEKQSDSIVVNADPDSNVNVSTCALQKDLWRRTTTEWGTQMTFNKQFAKHNSRTQFTRDSLSNSILSTFEYAKLDSPRISTLRGREIKPIEQYRKVPSQISRKQLPVSNVIDSYSLILSSYPEKHDGPSRSISRKTITFDSEPKYRSAVFSVIS